MTKKRSKLFNLYIFRVDGDVVNNKSVNFLNFTYFAVNIAKVVFFFKLNIMTKNGQDYITFIFLECMETL